MKYKFYINFFIHLLVLVIFSSIIIIFGNPIYGTTDDYILSSIVSGEFTGNLERQLIFIQPFIGNMMNFLQILIPVVNIYSFFLLLNVILVLTLFLSLINDLDYKTLIIYFFILTLLFWFTLKPTYTEIGRAHV